MRTTLIAAQSIDGYITQHDQEGTDFVSAADQTFLKTALQTCDCSVMGANTYRLFRNQIRARLTQPRKRIILTRQPEIMAADTVPGTLEFSADSPVSIINLLRAEGYQHCAILGGSQIYSQFIAAHLVDEYWLTLEPVLFGGGSPLFTSQTSQRLEFLSSTALSAQTLLLKYRTRR